MSVEFAVKLTDQVTAPTRSMAGGLAQAAKNANLLEKQMATLQNAATKAAAAGNVAGFQKASAQYASLGAEVNRLKSEFPELTNTMKANSDGSDLLEGTIAKLGGAMGIAKAAVGVLAAALAALGTALVEGAKMALEAGEALEKLTATMNALSGGAGPATIAVLDQLTTKLGMTRAELAPLAEQLLAMGIPAAKLKDQLTALATIKAIGIAGGSEEYLTLLTKIETHAPIATRSLAALYKTGVNIAEVAAKMGLSVKALEAQLKKGTENAEQFKSALASAIAEKGAEALAAQANSLSAQWALLQENIKKLFEGVNTKPFLEALKSMLSVFDQSTASGKALKFLVTQIFDGLFSAASKVLPYIKVFFLGMVVGALQFYIALKPTIAELKKLFANRKDGDELARKFAALGKAMFASAIAAAKLAAALLKIYEINRAMNGKLFGGNPGGAGKSVGGSFVDGIQQGILSKIAGAIAAVKALGTGMLASIKSVLGIASPSKEMMKLGVHAGTGFAQGVAAANDNVQRAGAGMGASVSAGAAQGAAKTGAAPAGATNTFNIELHVGGGASLAETKGAVLDGIADAFERLGITRATVFAA